MTVVFIINYSTYSSLCLCGGMILKGLLKRFLKTRYNVVPSWHLVLADDIHLYNRFPSLIVRRMSVRSGKSRVNVNSSYTISHANKIQTKQSKDAGGKMTKFRSLDDIPDSFPDNMDELDDRTTHSTHVQPPLFHNNGESLRQETAYLNQAIPSLRVLPAQVTGKAPPLPYDNLHSARESIQRSISNATVNQIPVPPNSKYFDYDESADDFDADELSPQRTSKTNAVTNGKEVAPPLPCEASSKSGSDQQQDSIYFSKKPRPVNFK